MSVLNRDALRAICKQHKLYMTPHLNDKLYCNYKGFVALGGLEEYTGLRALFLEGNALDSLEGLPPLKELRCLYVQENSLTHISHLENVENLDTLNISYNTISKLEGLSCCRMLRTLICTNNRLETLESIKHLADCPSINSLDLQNNNLKEPAILEVFKQLPDLKCLYLKGNPVVSAMKNYRKTMIAALPNLAYLDDRPVFEDERRLVQAWLTGGLDAEREERKKIKQEEEEAHRRNFEFMLQVRAEGFRKKRERMGLPPGDTDPALEGYSDGEYEFLEEPAELRHARERLAAYTGRPGEEEPPELADTRRQLAREGKAVQQGSYDAGDDTAAVNDGQVYLQHVHARQQELNEQGRPAAAATGGAAGPGPAAVQVQVPEQGEGSDAATSPASASSTAAVERSGVQVFLTQGAPDEGAAEGQQQQKGPAAAAAAEVDLQELE